MELRQLRYFVRVVEAGSIGRAAMSLGMVTSALSQQISRLLQRSASGVVPTDAGLAFFRQAQLALRHADDAVHAAQQARLAGHVSVGLSSTTASILGAPFVQAMNQRYPDIRLHLVEALSGHLADMLNGRQLDLAVVFHAEAASRCTCAPGAAWPACPPGPPPAWRPSPACRWCCPAAATGCAPWSARRSSNAA